MQTMLMSGPASSSPAREALETFFRLRRRLLILVVAILLGGVALAASVHPMFTATSTILIIPGPDYTVRTVAGMNASVNQSIERAEILATEVAILGSRDLQRRVLRDVGVASLYPGYAGAPGLVQPALAAVRRELAAWTGPAAPIETAVSESDALETALDEFGRDFAATASSESNTITLTFMNRDATTAARVLSAVERIYLMRRRELFADTQSTGVQQEAQRLREHLEEAERRLSDFKTAHDISNFATRQGILLQEQGTIENSLMEAQSQVDQQKARVTQLQGTIAGTPRQITAQDADVDGRSQALRANLDVLLAKRAELSAQYRSDSPAAQALAAQIATREAELARSHADRTPSGFHTSENPVYISTSVDIMRAQADMTAAKARQEKVLEQLAGVQAQQKELNLLEREFGELDRQRLQAQQDYADTAKILNERRIVEQVQSTKQADVRVLSEVVNPILPAATRKIILMVSACFAVLAAITTVLSVHYLRRGFLSAASVERECGLPVLVTIRDLPALAGDRTTTLRSV